MTMRRRLIPITLLAFAPPLTAQHAPTLTAPQLFAAADACMACHNGIVSPAGMDISFGTDWRASMMANAARDPYWQAAVRRETLEHPTAAGAIQDECSKCHMPMARYTAHAMGGEYEIFGRLPWQRSGDPLAILGADGVSCTVCHQIEAEGLGEESSFVGGFRVDSERAAGERIVYGPYEVLDGSARAMQSSGLFRPVQGPHVRESALCATCHTLFTHSLNADGEVIGELPEQVPYLEWLNSDYAEQRSCQSCHMPEVQGEAPISSVLQTARAGVRQHVFRGGNFFMPLVLNAFRAELGVRALPAELQAVSARTREHLSSRSARLEVIAPPVLEGDRVAFDVVVHNLAGHKLPTAYPSRRAWLHVVVTDGDGATVFESGALQPDGSIAGNDNDGSADRYEPHHAVIGSPGQVQIYEAVMADEDGRVTTGLLNGVRYLKDNRLLPTGFDKAGADPDVAVRGPAAEDADFAAGTDRVRYEVDVAGATGPFRVAAELWYQPIGFRWARNLGAFDAEEPARFVRYYDTLAGVSGTLLARAEGTLR